jgi:hypothetical protein
VKNCPSPAQRALLAFISKTATATAVAKITGVPAPTVRLVALGQPPRTEHAARLADLLGVSFMDWLPDDPSWRVMPRDLETAKALFGSDDGADDDNGGAQ